MPIFGTWIDQTGGTAGFAAFPQTGQWVQQTAICSSQTQAMYQQAALACSQQTTSWTTYQYLGLANVGSTAAQGIWMDAQQYYQLARNRVPYHREWTAEERRLQEEQAQAARLAAQQRQEEHIRKSRQALDRSRELLVAHLTPVQRSTFEKNQWFVVEGGRTKQKYRINTNRYAGNIDVLRGNKVSHRLCVHCGDVPMHDHHLAQKIMLEYDEDRILGLANRQAA